jgi:hypothetical protein
MRSLSGGVAHVASIIEKDLGARETGLQKPHIKGLADLSSSALASRSSNTAEWISILPRTNCAEKSRERYISRIISNELIRPLSVMRGFVPELMGMSGARGQTIVLSLDQSKISDGFECLMLSMRVGDLYRVGRAGISFAREVAGNLEDRAIADAVVEFNGVHRHGDKLAMRIVEACGDPGCLIDPRQKSASEEETVVVQVAGEDKTVRFHEVTSGGAWSPYKGLHRANSRQHLIESA